MSATHLYQRTPAMLSALWQLWERLTLPTDMGTFTYEGVTYQVRDLILRAGETEQLNPHLLYDILNEKVWSHDDEAISPMMVLRYPSVYPEHMQRIRDADLSYPLIVFHDHMGNIVVADGCHRLCKLWQQRWWYVRVRFVDLLRKE